MICRLCKQDLPKSSFSSFQAKYCNPCKRIRQLEQKYLMSQRSLSRQREKKPKKVTIESLAQLKKRAQRLVNKYCRERDREAGLLCISCQERLIEEGGHFWPMGSNSALRYCEDNINGQCQSCNKWQHGNLLNYRLNLCKKIGKARVEWLDEHHGDIKKWSREELEYLIEKYSKRLDNKQ